MSLLRKEDKFWKRINTLSDWKEKCLEAVCPNYNRCEIRYLYPMNYHFCTISVSSVTITNTIRTLIYYDYIEINSIFYSIVVEYSNLSIALFAVLLDECLPPNILVFLDYCCYICLQSPESFTINSMSYNISLLWGIKFHQFSESSFELILMEFDIIWNNIVIEPADS
jgi:hypothetical protein